MGAIELPLVCPDCESTSVVDIMTSAYVQDVYGWDKKSKRYVFGSTDVENYGELLLFCAVCDYKYSDEESVAFRESNPVTKAGS